MTGQRRRRRPVYEPTPARLETPDPGGGRGRGVIRRAPTINYVCISLAARDTKSTVQKIHTCAPKIDKYGYLGIKV